MKTMYHLKNIDGEIVDVWASSLKNAKIMASDFLGGDPSDYEERFVSTENGEKRRENENL